MSGTVRIALVALALSLGVLAAGPPATAQSVSVGINLGGIAFGFTDGYWDRDHHWHRWENARQAAAFRAQFHDHYYGWRHDRDEGQGWHSEDRWWEQH
jgi:hypothetical protein